MRLITSLGIGLIIVGVLAFVATSGAFDSTAADRSTTVETTDDGSAFLGLDYSNGERVELESADSDGGGYCGLTCRNFRYNDVKIITLEDNTPSQELTVEEVNLSIDNEDMIRGDELRNETTDNDDELSVILGDFSCPSEREGWFGARQTEDSGTVTVSIEASDGTITIDLDREITVECVEE